jgi:polar amino acid transport system substrate-binding protein
VAAPVANEFQDSGHESAGEESKPVGGVDAGILAAYGTLPGIDLSEALSHVRGNEERMLKLMRKFARDQASVAKDIRDALAENNPDVAQRLAHTLKGLAGLIGAARLQEKARLLEVAIKEDEAPEAVNFAALIENMETALEEVMGGLAKLEPEEDANGETLSKTIPVIRADAFPILERLSSMLEDGDAEALQCFEELEKAGVLPSESKEGARLRSLIESYAFDEAGDLLGELIQSNDQPVN